MIKIAHIVNPVKVTPSSDLYVAQPVTFETMQQAKDQAEECMDIGLYAAFFPEDEEIIPDYFIKSPPLERSTLDYFDLKSIKKLPFLKDILDRLDEASNADYFIYTNVDIALMPDFYLTIMKIIEDGHDAFIINRRTISTRFTQIENIPAMLREVRKGKKHPGYDCFIFKKQAYKNYFLAEGCVGINWIGRILASNLAAFSKKFRVFENLYLTFHIGNEQNWKDNKFYALEQHNELELIRVLKTLLDSNEVENKEFLLKSYKSHMRSFFYRGRPKNIIMQHSQELQLISPIKKTYPKGFPSDINVDNIYAESISQDPILIVGYLRSGTTLVQSLLATQKNIVSLKETHFFSRIWKILKVKNNRISPLSLKKAIKAIRSNINFSPTAERYVEKTANTTGLSPKMLFETIIIDNIIEKINPSTLQSVRWMEKTPHHIFHLNLIFSLYPNSKVIYVMRNLEKAILSRKDNFLFSNEIFWPIQRHIKQWLKGVAILEKYKTLKPESLIIVKIEDLIADKESEIKKICNFIGIKFDQSRLEFHKEVAKTLIFPWEVWKSNATKIITPDLSATQKRTLSDVDRYEIWRKAGDKMSEYGYSSAPPNISKNMIILSRLKNLFLMLRIAESKIIKILPRRIKRVAKSINKTLLNK